MSTNKTQNKTSDNWTSRVDEIFIKLGLTPNFIPATGSCIMPAPKRLKYAKQQQNTKEETKDDKEV